MSALRKPITELLFTIDDLERMPDDGKLYELIGGEMALWELLSKPPISCGHLMRKR